MIQSFSKLWYSGPKVVDYKGNVHWNVMVRQKTLAWVPSHLQPFALVVSSFVSLIVQQTC